MSAYKRVYSPDGEPFDVATQRANDLILQHGWTQQPPVASEPEEEAPKKTRRSRKKVEEPVEEPAVEEQDEPEDISFFGGDAEAD